MKKLATMGIVAFTLLLSGCGILGKTPSAEQLLTDSAAAQKRMSNVHMVNKFNMSQDSSDFGMNTDVSTDLHQRRLIGSLNSHGTDVIESHTTPIFLSSDELLQKNDGRWEENARGKAFVAHHFMVVESITNLNTLAKNTDLTDKAETTSSQDQYTIRMNMTGQPAKRLFAKISNQPLKLFNDFQTSKVSYLLTLDRQTKLVTQCTAKYEFAEGKKFASVTDTATFSKWNQSPVKTPTVN
ncbi:DUF6612 family protein [Lacticaseibacillus saniviri]|uniref:Lipoprotein n=2 Tax=Lacticaseibacillus saniviri TaxID=931533 RepID=A0A0R2MZK7_9LACO|nr:DUF6612 family protein [Lacticaseibacillus saniviri]KRO17181.1 hypothetical protein IV56_GL000507 [Lacticaseibacillus saniviri JCM 17471 = DSM 24301]MCG4281822.1 hypothetical protein [Lacticaseibacillus saniviri]